MTACFVSHDAGLGGASRALIELVATTGLTWSVWSPNRGSGTGCGSPEL